MCLSSDPRKGGLFEYIFFRASEPRLLDSLGNILSLRQEGKQVGKVEKVKKHNLMSASLLIFNIRILNKNKGKKSKNFLQ